MRPTSTIKAAHLLLEPIKPDDADGLFALLNDAGLHTFTGGEPMTRDELDRWISFVAPGRSPSGEDLWCNWVVRRSDDGAAVGTVQATVVEAEASLAWVVGSMWQGHGYAKEAAAAVATWLRAQGVSSLRANIHPEHAASNEVARSLGLSPTDQRVDGEVVWRSR